MPDTHGKQHLLCIPLAVWTMLAFPCAFSALCVEHLLLFVLHFALAALHVLVGLWGDRGCDSPLEFTLVVFCSLLSGSHDT